MRRRTRRAASPVTLPLVAHFAVMFFLSFGLSIAMKLPYKLAVTQGRHSDLESLWSLIRA